MPTPIQKTSVSQQVVNHVLDLIEEGALRPGDRLPVEREFADSLGISRVPLREGISALAALGIVERRHGDGNYIAGFSPDIMGRILRTYSLLDGTLTDDLFEARAVVEGAAARLAARNATQEDIAAMEADIAAMEAAIPDYIAGHKRLQDMLALDDLFHLRCAAASHNEFYIQFVNIVHTAGTDMGLYEAAYGTQPEKYYDSVKFHRLLLDAVRAGDEVQAQEVMCKHIEEIRGQSGQDRQRRQSL